jgi:uncharacterized protein (TIGR02594 family)
MMADMLTPFSLAQRFVGISELAGDRHHPVIQWALMLCGYDAESPDEIPWCAAFLNLIFWLLRLPRTKSARARSWLTLGVPVTLEAAVPGMTWVVLKQADGDAGPEVVDVRGHVGLYAGHDAQFVEVLGGNQQNSVSVARFPLGRILSIRTVAA